MSWVCDICGSIICSHEPPCFSTVAAHAWFDEETGTVILLCPDCLEEITWEVRRPTEEEFLDFLGDDEYDE